MNALLLTIALLAVDQGQASHPAPIHEGRIIERFRDRHPLPLDPQGNPEGRFQHLGRTLGESLLEGIGALWHGLIGTIELPFTAAHALVVGYIVAICGGLACLMVPLLLGGLILFFVIRLIRS